MTLKSIIDRIKSHVRNSHTVQARAGRKVPHLTASESNRRIKDIQPLLDEIADTEQRVQQALYAGRAR